MLTGESDQGPDSMQWSRRQMLQNRQDEGSRLSRARLGQAQDITPLEDVWDCLLLYGRRGHVACFSNGSIKALVER
jgi:hypothetical protein